MLQTPFYHTVRDALGLDAQVILERLMHVMTALLASVHNLGSEAEEMMARQRDIADSLKRWGGAPADLWPSLYIIWKSCTGLHCDEGDFRKAWTALLVSGNAEGGALGFLDARLWIDFEGEPNSIALFESAEFPHLNSEVTAGVRKVMNMSSSDTLRWFMPSGEDRVEWDRRPGDEKADVKRVELAGAVPVVAKRARGRPKGASTGSSKPPRSRAKPKPGPSVTAFEVTMQERGEESEVEEEYEQSDEGEEDDEEIEGGEVVDEEEDELDE